MSHYKKSRSSSRIMNFEDSKVLIVRFIPSKGVHELDGIFVFNGNKYEYFLTCDGDTFIMKDSRGRMRIMLPLDPKRESIITVTAKTGEGARDDLTYLMSTTLEMVG